MTQRLLRDVYSWRVNETIRYEWENIRHPTNKPQSSHTNSATSRTSRANKDDGGDKSLNWRFTPSSTRVDNKMSGTVELLSRSGPSKY
jgi:hypothetical protein